MKATIYSHTGQKDDQKVALPESIFQAQVNPDLMAQAIHVYKQNQAQHTSKVQTRTEVNLTKSKWYQQKGTGRARHGAKSAPIFVGGGVAHGPKGIKPKRKKLNKKMKKQSFRGALSYLAENHQITVIKDLDKIKPKTQKLASLLDKIKAQEPTLLIVGQKYPDLNLAGRNIPHLTITRFDHINIHDLLKTQHLIIDKQAIEPLTNWLAK